MTHIKWNGCEFFNINYVILLIFVFIIKIGLSNNLNSRYITKRVKISSKILNSDREILISIPSNYSFDKKYPIAYVLDGDYLFDNVVAQIQFNSYWNKYPDIIIVGVSHFGNRSELNVSNSLVFYDFFTNELIKYIDTNYSASGFNLLISHSYSGYFSSEIFIKKNSLFDAYLCISPVIYENLIPKMSNIIKNLNEQKYLYISTSDKDLSRHIDLGFNAKKKLSLLESSIFNFNFDFIPNKTHISIVPISIVNGLDWVFSLYQDFDWNDLKKLSQSNVDLYEVFKDKYTNIYKVYGVDIEPRELDIIYVGELLISNRKYEIAIDFAQKENKLNSKNSYLFYSILGQVYEMKKEYKKSLKYYKKMYLALPEETANKEDFLNEVKRLEEIIETNQ